MGRAIQILPGQCYDAETGAFAGGASGFIAGGIGGGSSGLIIGAVGDLLGQLAANRANNKPAMQCGNWGEVVGAGLGGFFGGAAGDAMAQDFTKMGLTSLNANLAANYLGGLTGLGGVVMGNAFSNGMSRHH